MILEFILSSPINFLTGVLTAGLFVYGLYLAANHTWKDDDDNTVGLALYKLRLATIAAAKWMDSKMFLNILRGIVITTLPLALSALGVFKWYDTANPEYLWLLSALIGLVFHGKSIEYINDMVLNCFRCMPTFWVAIPWVVFVMIDTFWGGSTSLLYSLPLAILFTSGVSTVSTFLHYIYQDYEYRAEATERMQNRVIRIPMPNYFEQGGVITNDTDGEFVAPPPVKDVEFTNEKVK